MRFTRLYCDDHGESHFEDIELQFQMVDFAPPAPPLEVSVLGPATESLILRAEAGWQGDWHPAPYRQWHLYLSGEVVVETSDGDRRRIRAGDLALVEDTSGKGHRSRVHGSKAAVIAVVKLSQ